MTQVTNARNGSQLNFCDGGKSSCNIRRVIVRTQFRRCVRMTDDLPNSTHEDERAIGEMGSANGEIGTPIRKRGY